MSVLCFRTQMLEASRQLHKYFHDCKDVLGRILEKQNSMPDELGRDSGSVSALQRKHTNFIQDLQGLQQQVQAIQEQSATLQVIDLYYFFWNGHCRSKQSNGPLFVSTFYKPSTFYVFFCAIFLGRVRWRQSPWDRQPGEGGGEGIVGAPAAGREPEVEAERHQRPLPILPDGPQPHKLDGRPTQADGHIGETKRRLGSRAFDEQPPGTQGGNWCKVNWNENKHIYSGAWVLRKKSS